MNEGGFEKRGATQSGSGEVTGHEERRVAPGKVTRTSKLEPSPQAEVTSPQQPPASVQQRRAAVEPAREERAALTERWLDTAMRPDVHPPPVQRKRSGATDTPIDEDSGFEREADVMGARAARGQHADGAAASAGTNRAGQAMVPISTSSSPAIQAKSADDAPLWENAEEDATALLEAFQGLGTDEQTVYRVLNQPPEMVKAIVGVYNARYNQHTGRGLIEDLRAEFDEVGGQADWQLVVGQLARAGVPVPGAEARYERQDPMAAEQRHARIVATPNVRVAVPGTRITYALVRGAELHAPGSRYTYQWYFLNDPETSQKLGYPARVEGSERPRVEATARFVGNHKVICKEIYDPASGPPRPPVFYEFPQTVVPEGTLAQDALEQAPAAVDPARQLEVLETFLQVLREAEQQPGSSPLDSKTAAAYEKQIAALLERLASTEGAERIPIQAVHVDREKARVSPLRAFVARTQGGEPGEQETWRLVDITNPESRRLSGEYEGRGKDARAAIFAALAAWDEGNRYPTGRIRLEVDADAAGEAITHELQTDGMSFWDSISEFFAEVGFWTGMGALAVGVVTAVAPVPGMRIVSGLLWASILASSASATINIAQRHTEDMSSAREDVMDVLTIVGNILAGAWMRGARVLVNGQGGTKIGTGLLIGQIGTDGAQGIVLGLEYLEQYDRVMAIEDPKQRTDALMELLRSAALAGGMLFLSVRGTRSDLGQLGKPGAQGSPTRLDNQGELTGLEIPGRGKHQQDGSPEVDSHGVSGLGESTKQRAIPEDVRQAVPGLDDFLASGSMSTKGRDALLTLAMEAPNDELIRSIVQKAIAHGDLPNMDRWLVQAARQRKNPGQLLDLQASLDDAIRLRQAGESGVELEVFYSEGRKLTNAGDIAASSNKANIDVVTETMRREWKRVNRPITSKEELLGQIKDARLKFRNAGLERGVGGQKNIGMVDFGDQLMRGGQSWEWAQEKIRLFLARDRIAREYLDELIVRVDGVEHVFRVP